LPIGVFASGIGGLTVLEALLTADFFNNDTLSHGADGRPDFAGERFLYLGDQANMPYGNYPAQGREDYLRELILKDLVFQLGKRYHARGEGGAFSVRMDKPPVKAIVIACNTATAYGLENVREALRRWHLPVLVIGVVEAGARGLKEAPGDGAVGVLATVGTCASEVYPRTIARTLGLAGRTLPMVTQWGSARLAGVIEGDPAFATPIREQVVADVRALVEAHRHKVQATSMAPVPLQKIVLGCTHYPLVTAELDAAFETLRAQPDLAPWIAPKREFVNPAEWTARELFKELARAHLRRVGKTAARVEVAAPNAGFFISVAQDSCPGVKLAAPGVLDTDYKFRRQASQLQVEDTVVVPMTRILLPEMSRKLLWDKLPTVWKLLPEE
jgi:glutamate racemase